MDLKPLMCIVRNDLKLISSNIAKSLKNTEKTLLLFRQGYTFTVVFLQRLFIKDLEGFIHGIINFKIEIKTVHISIVKRKK